MVFDYAIVEFVEDNPPSIGISPQCWIESKPDGMFCYWPRTNISFRARKAEIPDKEKWAKYPVRILHYTENYENAMNLSKNAEYTSNLSSDESEGRGHRKRKQKRFSDSEISSETTAKGTGLAESAGKEDPVELDSSPTL